MSTTIDIVLTNNANIASVRAAIARLGYQTRDADRRTVEDATHLILPGVGTLASARDAARRPGDGAGRWCDAAHPPPSDPPLTLIH